MSIKKKLYIYLSSFSIFLLGVLILFYQVTYNALKDRVITDAESIATQISQALHHQINYIEEDLRLFTISQNLINHEKDEIIKGLPSASLLQERFITFFELEHGFKVYDRVTLFDITGDTLEATSPSANPTTKKWWQEVVKDGVSYSLIKDNEGMQHISIAILLHDNHGEPWGVIQGVIPLRSLIREKELALKKIDAHQVDLITPDGSVKSP